MNTKRKKSVIAITSNKSQPFLFSIAMDSTKKKVKIHAKNKQNSVEQYFGEYTESDLKKIGFYQSIKGFYNRIKIGMESTSADQLKTYYNIQSNAMQIILEEISKFDDDSTKWSLALKKKKIEKRVDDIAAVTNADNNTNTNNAALKQIQFVVKQVKDKFNAEKEERMKLEQRIQALEQLCTKLTKKLIKVTNDLKKERDKTNNKDTKSMDDIFRSQEQKIQSPSNTKHKSNEMESKLSEMKSCIENIDSKYGNELHVIHQKMNDVRPKLVRLKTRRDFASEQAFVDYITNKLDKWDANKFGPILVRVLSSASGKAKHFIGYVGEPQKWNHTICKVQWFGLGKKLPEAVEWKALDVFLPLSAFYYPDCPQARAYCSRNDNINKQQL